MISITLSMTAKSSKTYCSEFAMTSFFITQRFGFLLATHSYPLFLLNFILLKSGYYENPPSTAGQFFLARKAKRCVCFCLLVSYMPINKMRNKEATRITPTLTRSYYDLGRPFAGFHHGIATVTWLLRHSRHHRPLLEWGSLQSSATQVCNA